MCRCNLCYSSLCSNIKKSQFMLLREKTVCCSAHRTYTLSFATNPACLLRLPLHSLLCVQDLCSLSETCAFSYLSTGGRCVYIISLTEVLLFDIECSLRSFCLSSFWAKIKSISFNLHMNATSEDPKCFM